MSPRKTKQDSGNTPSSATASQRRFPNRTLPPNTTGEKLPVAPPTTVGKFAVILLMHICRKILLVNTVTKLAIYSCGLFGISLMTDLFPFPRSYFSNKGNFLNQWFVKLGWGWTCTMLGLFIYMTSHTYCAGNRKSINRNLIRLAVGTAWWFVSTQIFDFIHASYGHCYGGLVGDSNDRISCEAGGRRWIPFDVSGHAFLLIHCLLTISEEVHCIAGWERLDEIAADAQKSQNLRCTPEELSQVRESYAKFTPYIRAVVAALTLLTVIWEVMLTTTALYFHNFPQKILGGFFAVAGWFLTYRVWYVLPLDTWTPGLPGQGVIKYQS